MQGTMSAPASELVVSFLRVHDNLAEQSFTVNLADVVEMIEGPSEPDGQRSLIIQLVNDEILDQHPHAAGTRHNPLDVTLAEFSDLKMKVVQKVRAQSKADGRANR
jgi:hypothetical protein